MAKKALGINQVLKAREMREELRRPVFHMELVAGFPLAGDALGWQLEKELSKQSTSSLANVAWLYILDALLVPVGQVMQASFRNLLLYLAIRALLKSSPLVSCNGLPAHPMLLSIRSLLQSYFQSFTWNSSTRHCISPPNVSQRSACESSIPLTGLSVHLSDWLPEDPCPFLQ